MPNCFGGDDGTTHIHYKALGRTGSSHLGCNKVAGTRAHATGCGGRTGCCGGHAALCLSYQLVGLRHEKGQTNSISNIQYYYSEGQPMARANVALF